MLRHCTPFFFNVYVEGAETASIGLASHPPVVLHREDVIERNESGTETIAGLAVGSNRSFRDVAERILFLAIIL